MLILTRKEGRLEKWESSSIKFLQCTRRIDDIFQNYLDILGTSSEIEIIFKFSMTILKSNIQFL